MNVDTALAQFRQSLANLSDATPMHTSLNKTLDTYLAGGGDLLVLRRALVNYLGDYLEGQTRWQQLLDTEESVQFLEELNAEALAEHRAGLTEPLEDLLAEDADTAKD